MHTEYMHDLGITPLVSTARDEEIAVVSKQGKGNRISDSSRWPSSPGRDQSNNNKPVRRNIALTGTYLW